MCLLTWVGHTSLHSSTGRSVKVRYSTSCSGWAARLRLGLGPSLAFVARFFPFGMVGV